MKKLNILRAGCLLIGLILPFQAFSAAYPLAALLDSTGVVVMKEIVGFDANPDGTANNGLNLKKVQMQKGSFSDLLGRLITDKRTNYDSLNNYEIKPDIAVKCQDSEVLVPYQKIREVCVLKVLTYSQPITFNPETKVERTLINSTAIEFTVIGTKSEAELVFNYQLEAPEVVVRKLSK